MDGHLHKSGAMALAQGEYRYNHAVLRSSRPRSIRLGDTRSDGDSYILLQLARLGSPICRRLSYKQSTKNLILLSIRSWWFVGETPALCELPGSRRIRSELICRRKSSFGWASPLSHSLPKDRISEGGQCGSICSRFGQAIYPHAINISHWLLCLFMIGHASASEQRRSNVDSTEWSLIQYVIEQRREDSANAWRNDGEDPMQLWLGNLCLSGDCYTAVVSLISVALRVDASITHLTSVGTL